MLSSFGKFLWQLVPSSPPGALFSSRSTSGKRCRWEGVPCDVEHTVIYLLLQEGHVSPRGLAALCCVSRSFRRACDDDNLWHLAAILQWPSLNSDDVDQCLRNSGGYRRFFQLLYSSKVGDLQLSIPVNQNPQLIDDITFFLDLSYRGKPVFSRRIERSSGSLVQQTKGEAVQFQLPDCEVGSVLVHGKPGLSRRTLERCAKDLHVSCIGLRMRDGKFCLLLDGKMGSSGMIGGSVYASLQSTFALPGIFHILCFTIDTVVSVTSRVREVERAEGEEQAAAAATSATGPLPPPAFAVASTGPTSGTPTTTAAVAPRVVPMAGAGTPGVAHATAPSAPASAGGAAPVAGLEMHPHGLTVAGLARGIPVPAPAAGSGPTHTHPPANPAPTPAPAGPPPVAPTAPGSAAAAPNVAATAAATDTLVDILLGDLSFQLKLSIDQGDSRRNKRSSGWKDLKWK